MASGAKATAGDLARQAAESPAATRCARAHGIGSATTTASVVAMITAEASADQPAPVIPRCGISNHAPPDGDGCPRHGDGGDGDQSTLHSQDRHRHVDHRIREGGQQQQDEQRAVVGVVGAKQAEHLRGQQAGDQPRGDQERADQPQSAARLCPESFGTVGAVRQQCVGDGGGHREESAADHHRHGAVSDLGGREYARRRESASRRRATGREHGDVVPATARRSRDNQIQAGAEPETRASHGRATSKDRAKEISERGHPDDENRVSGRGIGTCGEPPQTSSAAMMASRARLPTTLPSRENSARRTPSSAALITSSRAGAHRPGTQQATSQPVPTAVWTRSGRSSAPSNAADAGHDGGEDERRTAQPTALLRVRTRQQPVRNGTNPAAVRIGDQGHRRDHRVASCRSCWRRHRVRTAVQNT